MNKLNEMLEKFGRLVDKVRYDHRKKGALVGTGHDFCHALTVSWYCLRISQDPVATLAWLAAICHNTDRLFPDWTNRQIEERLRLYLEKEELPGLGKDLVVEAVLNHSKPPSKEDKPPTYILKDADKLGNLGCEAVIRASQHRHNLPPLNPFYLGDQRPPGSDFKNPGSVWWDIQGMLEWQQEGWIRTKKAKKLAAPLFARLKKFAKETADEFKSRGIIPYPFPEDYAS